MMVGLTLFGVLHGFDMVKKKGKKKKGKKERNCGHNIAITCAWNTNSWPQNNVNIIPGQLGKQMEHTFSRNCNSLRDVLKVSVFFNFVINSFVSAGAAAHTNEFMAAH